MYIFLFINISKGGNNLLQVNLREKGVICDYVFIEKERVEREMEKKKGLLIQIKDAPKHYY